VLRGWHIIIKNVVFPNFMDIPERQPPLPGPDGPQYILCVGRIEPLKGQDTLARAFALVAHKYPAARLVIVGPDRWPGKHRFSELLPELIPDPEIRARIDLPGAVPLEKVAQMLRSARLAVVSSRGFESFSYAACEALAAGRPVISTNIGALPELVQHERTGLTVPAGDPRAMAEAMDRALADRAESQRLAAAGFEHVRERCHTPRVLPQILNVYEDATNFYSQVKAAGSERTAVNWRAAIADARDRLDAERSPDPGHDVRGTADPPTPADFLPKLDVA
jgi:glycosyltransferase involved in cell wall biosynthesis